MIMYVSRLAVVTIHFPLTAYEDVIYKKTKVINGTRTRIQTCKLAASHTLIDH